MLLGMTQPLLDKVRAKLAGYVGASLSEVGVQTGMSYDTLLRIREGRTDPPFGKVQTLAAHFWPKQYGEKR